MPPPFKANQDRRHRIPKQRHRVTNWSEYDAALRQRGSLTVLCGRPERGNGFHRRSTRQSARPGSAWLGLAENGDGEAARVRGSVRMKPRSAWAKGPVSYTLTWDISCQAAMVSSSGNLRQCPNGVQV